MLQRDITMSFGTFWRMTINNYTPTDVALVRQGYPDDIRKLVYTFEEGENGTPHIQAFIQMKRSVRMSHMKKLFPRSNLATMDSAEWRLNQHNYAQKLDETARSPAVVMNGDPLHTVEGTIRRVCEAIFQSYEHEEDMDRAKRWVEREMVQEDYTLAKVFVSATYKSMWKEFGGDIYMCVRRKYNEKLATLVEEEEQRVDIPTHTHTHAHAKKFSREGGITQDASEGNDESGTEVDASSEEDCEDYQDGTTASDEGDDESTGDDHSASSVSSGSRE